LYAAEHKITFKNTLELRSEDVLWPPASAGSSSSQMIRFHDHVGSAAMIVCFGFGLYMQ
jgi:hypothetical protein